MKEKPSIVIVVDRSLHTASFEPLLWGIEEEGIPFEVRPGDNGSLREMAKQAAESSPLNVGIALSRDGGVALHHRDLPVEAPLFFWTAAETDGTRLRRLGMNAARLVKGQPLATMERGPGDCTPAAVGGDSDKDVEELVARILEAIIGAG